MCGDGRQGREAVTAGPGHGVLAGYDWSPRSEQALTWAAREARAREAVLTVCQAWAPGYPAPAAEVAAFDLARRSGEETVARGVRYARALMGSSEVRPLLVAGPAAHVLCERSADAEMLVVSARGHGGLAGLLLGSVSSQVAAHARGRVVVVRGHWRAAAACGPGPVVVGGDGSGVSPGAVGVGVDGSAASQAAVPFAAEEAALRGAALLAVCALADSPGNRGGAHVLQEDFEKIMVSCEKEHPDVVVRRQVADGSARAELLRATCDAQMLIVGS